MKECGICYETKLEKVLPCGHSTCHECFDNLRGHTCPYCRAPFREPTVDPVDRIESNIEYWLDYDPSNWSVYSRFTRYGTEVISVYRNEEIPRSWRNESINTAIKHRRFRRRRFRRNN